MEIWRDIEGYEGMYQVSNYGNGRTLDRYVTMKHRGGGYFTRLFKGKEMVKSMYPNGYLFFSVRKNNIPKQILVHRAVAKAFLPNPENLLEINHKDENKTNNLVFINDDGSVDFEKSNLEWCSHSYNSTYNDRHIKIGKQLRNRKDLSKIVYKLSLDDKLIETYPSASEAARQNGVNVPRIIQCCQGGYYNKKRHKWENKTVKGHKYSYEHP